MFRRTGAWVALGAMLWIGSLGCESDDSEGAGGSSSGSGASASSSSATSAGQGGAGASGGDAGVGAGGGSGGTGGSVNQAPIVTIVEPAQGSTFVVNTQVTLEATVSDPEDGRLPQRSIFWEGSHGAIVDPLGTGELITTEFYEPNEWVLTVTATDSEGLETSASVTVTVTE